MGNSALTIPVGTAVYRQSSDPGAVGAGALWVDTTTPGPPWHISVRDGDDLTWTDLLFQYTASGNIQLLSALGAQLSIADGFILGSAGDNGSGATANLAAGTGADGGSLEFFSGQTTGGYTQARLSVYGGSDGDVVSAAAELVAGNAAPGSGADGGYITIAAGDGDGAGEPGEVSIKTGGSTGSAGQLLTAQGDTTLLYGLVSAAITASGDAAAVVAAITGSLPAAGLSQAQTLARGLGA